MISLNDCAKEQVLGADGFAIILSAVNHNSADRNLQFEGFRNLGPLVAFNDAAVAQHHGATLQSVAKAMTLHRGEAELQELLLHISLRLSWCSLESKVDKSDMRIAASHICQRNQSK